MSGALGTYAAALIVLAASTAAGAGILAISGRREWSWTAPAVGLATITIVAWWAVRLPGHGWSALAAVALVSTALGVFAALRLDGFGQAAREAWPVLGAVGLTTAIPFAVEGHFGVLGTGFNVDMSQHLFAADWLADPDGPAPGLFEQGYPLGPHALAVAAAELTGSLTTAFSGVTIAVPLVVGLIALTGIERWPLWRRTVAAALIAIAYLVATYFAQGAFKELFEIALLVGFALWLGELRRLGDAGPGAGLPGAVLAAGTLYAYSSPGLGWIVGTFVIWALLELLVARDRVGAVVRGALPAAAVAVAVALLLVAPEIDRIVDFGGSVGTVSDSTREAVGRGDDGAIETREPERARERLRSDKLRFDDDLGNLFGQISPLEALGVWPSGDFRVAPGDGAIPAPVFYLGALLGALALAMGARMLARTGETALLAALLAALAIWIAARIGSTPYTSAKALAVLGGVVMLVTARGVLRPPDAEPRPEPLAAGRLGAAIAAAFILAAAASSALALGNAPVGPSDYHPGARELSDRFAGRATLVLVPDEVMANQHGSEFYGWEFREATPPCISPASAADPEAPTPPPWSRVAVVDGGDDAPFSDVELVRDTGGVAFWRVVGRDRTRADEAEPACPA